MKPLRITLLLLLAVALLGLTASPLRAFQTADAQGDEATDAGQITSVTVHRGWAAVTRTIRVSITTTDFVLHVPDLPASLVPDSLLAEILGEPGRSLMIREYQQLSSGNNDTVNADEPQITELRLVITAIPERNNNNPQPPIFPRTISLNVNYVVMNADWAPVYSLYAYPKSNEAVVRSDILVGQNSGEDWNGVILNVSSAKGRLPDWHSAFQMKKIGIVKGTRRSSANRRRQELSTTDIFHSFIDLAPGNGSVFQGDNNPYDWYDSPLIQHAMKGKVTVPTGSLEKYETDNDATRIGTQNDQTAEQLSTEISEAPVAQKNMRIRFQLDEFRIPCNFHYVAIPTVSQEAFLVGTLRNMNENHLLPGPAALFLNSTYTGEMLLPDLAPEDEIEIAFGTDPQILVHRREIKRRKRKTGLLSDGREIQITYQLSLINRSPKPAAVELWDQIPVSDSGDIDITVENESQLLSKNESYLNNQRTQGLLRWDISLPQDASSFAPMFVDYTLIISHPKDVQPYGLPQ